MPIRAKMPNGTVRPFREGTPASVIQKAQQDMLADMKASGRYDDFDFGEFEDQRKDDPPVEINPDYLIPIADRSPLAAQLSPNEAGNQVTRAPTGPLLRNLKSNIRKPVSATTPVFGTVTYDPAKKTPIPVTKPDLFIHGAETPPLKTDIDPSDFPTFLDDALKLQENKRIQAMMATIKDVESTNQYDLITGGQKFTDFSTHPRVYVKKFDSTAAGAYQLTVPTWKGSVRRTGITDFSPEAQDIAAADWLRETGAAASLLKDNDVDAAIFNAAKKWAAFPSSAAGREYFHGRRTNSLETIKSKYNEHLKALAP